MPIYEYKCGKCGVFELIQRITEDSIKRCPTCKSKVERIVSRTSFVLKGSGWYATDYSRKPANSTDSSSGSTDKGASTNGTSSTSSDLSAASASSDKGSGDTAKSTTPKSAD